MFKVKYLLIDANGNEVARYDRLEFVTKNLYAVRLNNKWGFINENANLLTNIIYDFYESQDYIINECIKVEKNKKYALMDYKGNIISDWYDDIINLFDNNIIIAKLNNKFALIKKIGLKFTNVCPFEFDQFYRFNEGFIIVIKDKKRNFMDTSGNLISKIYFDNALEFYNGFAEVYLNGKWTYITKTGDMLTEAKFDALGTFYEGISSYKIGKKYGYIDEFGNDISGPIYDSAKNFENGKAAVRKDKNWFYINKKGKKIRKLTESEVYEVTTPLIMRLK